MDELDFRVLGEDLISRDITSRMRLGKSGGAKDSTRPSIVITSSSSLITASNPTVTFTFSEPVTGFALADITVGNGTAGSFTQVSSSVYTAVITPTAAGTVTVDVAAGVCMDAAGNTNTAAVQWSILSTLGFTGVHDYTDISVLFKDAARTLPVTAADDVILGMTDKSPAANHLSTATGPAYKTNIINGLSAALFSANTFLQSAGDIISAGSWTGLIVAQGTAAVDLFLNGKTTSNTGKIHQGTFASASRFFFGTDAITTVATVLTDPHIWIVQYNSATAKVRVRLDGTATWYEANAVNYVPFLNCFGASRNAASSLVGYMYYELVSPGVLSDAVINAFRAFLNTKFGSVFF